MSAQPQQEQSAVWTPQWGPQYMLLTCPIQNILYGGARGGGKTDGALGDWMSHRQTWGPHAKGIIFRRTMPEFEEVMARSTELYPRTGAEWLSRKSTWVWPDGATLKFRYMDRDVHASRYQGHSYNWMTFEEIGNFPSPEPVKKLRATLRSPIPGMPKRFLATANPGGPGHSWVKQWFIDPAPPFTPFLSREFADPPEWGIYIPSRLEDNKLLMKNDPGYEAKLRATGPAWLVKAWREGLWDIVAGAAFEQSWNPERHILRPFRIPQSWDIFRAFDWGSSRPFSVGWWAVSNGEPVQVADGTFRSFFPGTIIRIAEWYGWNGKPNEGIRMRAESIAKGIMEREHAMGLQGRVRAGPADSSIFEVTNGQCIADDMALHGATFVGADKKPGSRSVGLQRVAMMLEAGLVHPMERPGMFVFESCRQFIRTMPLLPRDPTNPDDVDTDSEDHIYDETRYMATFNPPTLTAVKLLGH